jgi:transcriptional regulator with XRE-family HTH domain
MEEGNWNISALEKKAGIKVGTLRNIFQGKSNNPSAETLLAIANTLECSVDELLGRDEYSKKQAGNPIATIAPSAVENDYEWNPELFEKANTTIRELLSSRKVKITSEQAFFLVKESYLFSIKKGKSGIDQDFVEWLMDKTI